MATDNDKLDTMDDLKAKLMKNWRFRFWYYVYMPYYWLLKVYYKSEFRNWIERTFFPEVYVQRIMNLYGAWDDRDDLDYSIEDEIMRTCKHEWEVMPDDGTGVPLVLCVNCGAIGPEPGTTTSANNTIYHAQIESKL